MYFNLHLRKHLIRPLFAITADIVGIHIKTAYSQEGNPKQIRASTINDSVITTTIKVIKDFLFFIFNSIDFKDLI